MDERIILHPGFRFNPTDEELITFYLKPKVLGQKLSCNIVEERQLYGPDANPWQVFQPEKHPWILSEYAPGKFEKVTYVFVNLTRKATVKKVVKDKKKGVREQYIKKAGCGTWDGQTKRSEIRDCNDDLIGEKRMLSFEINEVCDLDLSKVGYWKMHEYHLCGVNKNIINSNNVVLCRISLDYSKNPPIKPRPNTNPTETSKNTTNVDCNQEGVSESCGGGVPTQTRRDDLVVVDTYKAAKREEGDYEDDIVEISGVEWKNSNVKSEADSYPKPKQEQTAKDTSANRGKRKLQVETSYTITKKLSLTIN